MDVENHFIMSPSSAYGVIPEDPDTRQVVPDVNVNHARQDTISSSYENKNY